MINKLTLDKIRDRLLTEARTEKENQAPERMADYTDGVLDIYNEVLKTITRETPPIKINING